MKEELLPEHSTKGSVVFGWPSDGPDWVDELAVAGPELLHRTGQTWKPAHAAALRRGEARIARNRLDIDSELACRFAIGESIPCEPAGWQVVYYDGRPLGWVKGVSGVGKNQLPTAARSRVPMTA